MPAVEQGTSTLPHAFHDKYTQLRLPLLMEAKCSLKLHQTLKCSRLCGVIMNVTTQQSF